MNDHGTVPEISSQRDVRHEILSRLVDNLQAIGNYLHAAQGIIEKTSPDSHEQLVMSVKRALVQFDQASVTVRKLQSLSFIMRDDTSHGVADG